MQTDHISKNTNEKNDKALGLNVEIDIQILNGFYHITMQQYTGMCCSQKRHVHPSLPKKKAKRIMSNVKVLNISSDKCNVPIKRTKRRMNLY